MHVRSECVLRPSPRQPEAGKEEEGVSLLNGQAAASAGGGALGRPVQRRARRPDFAARPWPGGQCCGQGRASARTHTEGQGAEVRPRPPGQVSIGGTGGLSAPPQAVPGQSRAASGCERFPCLPPSSARTSPGLLALQGDVPHCCTCKGSKH